MEAKLDLTAEEHDVLIRTGHLEIDDPVRGWIQIRMPFQEDKTGVVGRMIYVKVLRSGEALEGKE